MILTNDFHNTEYRTRKSASQLRGIAYRVYSYTASDADKALVRRIKGALCPSWQSGCVCGGNFGERPGQI
jgi:hypothetical protein